MKRTLQEIDCGCLGFQQMVCKYDGDCLVGVYFPTDRLEDTNLICELSQADIEDLENQMIQERIAL